MRSIRFKKYQKTKYNYDKPLQHYEKMMLQKYENYIKPQSYTNILTKFSFNNLKIPHFCTELIL
jgi:hypothetical protein